ELGGAGASDPVRPAMRFERSARRRTRDNRGMLTSHPLPPDTDLLALHRVDPKRYPLLLQSGAHGTAQGRRDMLLVADGARLQLDADGCPRDHDGALIPDGFLDALDAQWRALRLPRDEPRW